MKHVYTDGGCCSVRPGEKNDCTVRATAVCLGIPYPEAYDKLAALGRKRNKGARFGVLYPKLGLKLLPGSEDWPRRTLKYWEPMLREGRYVVRIRDHVFAVVDGEVFDKCTIGARCRVMGIYEFEQTEKALEVRAPRMKPRAGQSTTYFISP